MELIMGLIIGAGGGGFIGYLWGRQDEREKWEKQAINKNLAQYNPKTSKWEWINQ